MADHVYCEIKDDVANIVLDRPEKLNAFNPTFLEKIVGGLSLSTIHALPILVACLSVITISFLRKR